MQTLPATYLELRATFILRGLRFAEVARELGASKGYVHQTLRMSWGRPDMPATSELGQKILALVEAKLHESDNHRAVDVAHDAAC